MGHRFLHTRHDYLLTLLRLALGVIFFAHGAQKVLGWFGGHGLSASLNAFTTGMHIPGPLAVLAISAEFLGGVGLLFGFLTRLAAFGIAIDMLVAIFVVHWQNGLFMNWYGNQKGEGFEFHLLAIAIAFTIVARGAGAWSLDGLFDRGLGAAMLTERAKEDRVAEGFGGRNPVLPF